MSRRAFRAGLCAAAAIAFLLAALVPWFEDVGGAGDDERPRATYQLSGGERCDRGRCRDGGYTGAPGLRDDLFAVAGWATLAGALGTLALTLAVAAARGRHRPLRAWAAASAATTAGLGALFVASETLSPRDELTRGWGLAAVTIGAVLAGVALALPVRPAAPDRRPERRWLPALAIAVGAVLAWVSLVDHGWWRVSATFRMEASSPLGHEVCDDGECAVGRLASGGLGFAVLARATAMLAAALLVPAAGAAARCVQGRAAGAWGTAALALGLAALVCGAGAALLVPGSGAAVSWGVPAFLGAMGAVLAGTLLGRRWVTEADVEEPAVVARAERPAPRATSRPLATLPALAATGPDANPNRHPSANPIPRPHPNPSPNPTPSPGPSPTASPGPTASPSPSSTASPSPGASPIPTWSPNPNATMGGAGPFTLRVGASAGEERSRRAPRCPTCKQSTLWHGKRNAWWCSSCKRVL